ncbi:MAG: hypothetical protein ACTH31_14200, partial [Pseudoclavibacter sp.]
MGAFMAVCAAVGVVGALLIVAGALPAGDTGPARPPRFFTGRVRMRLSRRRRMLAIGGLVAGIALWFATGWVVFLIGVGLAALLLPVFFGTSGTRER